MVKNLIESIVRSALTIPPWSFDYRQHLLDEESEKQRLAEQARLRDELDASLRRAARRRRASMHSCSRAVYTGNDFPVYFDF